MDVIKQELMSPENKSIFINLGIFAAAVAFLQSPLAEYLIPQYASNL